MKKRAIVPPSLPTEPRPSRGFATSTVELAVNGVPASLPSRSLGSMSTVLPGIDVDLDLLADICRRYGVARLDVFGSAGRGELTDASDIDVLYELAPDTRLGWAIEDLARELTEALGRPVDLVSRRYLHRRLRDHVLAEAAPLYAA